MVRDRSQDLNFTVIIVGGSIAGLVLAHSLDRVGIHYVVLESNHEIAPQVGASVGIMPNGARILDQLGLFDQIELEIEPLIRSHICYPDGFEFSSDFSVLFQQRFGYPLAFLERHKFLQMLYDALQDKSRVYLGEKVVQIEQTTNKMCVRTRNQALYYGDLVVGADGVRSQTRTEMWRIADSLTPGLINSEEKMALFAEYICVFGTSSPVPQLQKGETIACFYNSMTVLTFQGKDGQVFWFVIKKMDRKHYYPNIPHFDQIDAEKLCAQVFDHKVWKRVKFRDIWKARKVHTMVALEENVFDHWYYDRIVCLGDSMHKMTPNMGQGANSAIESVAALVNHLNHMINVRRIIAPSDDQIAECLESFTQSRLKRARKTVDSAAFLTRLQARDGLIYQFIGRYIVPFAGDFPADYASGVIREAPKLDFLPCPRRSGVYWAQKERQPLLWVDRIKNAALLVLRTCAYSGTLVPALSTSVC